MPALGRLVEFDEKSKAFPIRAALRRGALTPRSYTWSCDEVLDQGNDPACVGFSWAHEIIARPAPTKGVTNDLALGLYRAAQRVDEWPGEDYEGTSVLAGAKAAKARGYFDEYRWAFSLNELILALGYHGPAVIGINWYEGMDWPDSDGILHPTGDILGGHALLANGVGLQSGLVRLHNSWSADWGKNGEAFITFEDLDRLLGEDGEACFAMRRRGPNLRRTRAID